MSYTDLTVTVTVVETMPEHLRHDHRAARNWGQYPLNGAERSVVLTDDVDDYITDDGEYDHVVAEYTAKLDGGVVEICDSESHWVGTGKWDGSIQDCTADLGDDVYEALDTALLDAGASGATRSLLDLSDGCTGDAAGDTWYECPDCGDYAWVAGKSAPDCSCGRGMDAGETVEVDTCAKCSRPVCPVCHACEACGPTCDHDRAPWR